MGGNTKCLSAIYGRKVTGQRWVLSLIRKLWDTGWDIWNYRNHTIYETNGPMRYAVLAHANTRISYYFNSGTIGLATRCHFLFKTRENTILYFPIRQKLGWITAIYSAQMYAHKSNTRRQVYLRVGHIFLDCITKNHPIPTLRKFEQFTPLKTTEGHYITLSLFIEQEDNILLSKDLDSYQNQF